MSAPAITRTLTLGDGTRAEQLELVFKALDSNNRLRILSYLTKSVASVNEIATALGMPPSTTALHIETLAEAGLIRTELENASRGLRKVCVRTVDQIILDLPGYSRGRSTVIEISMPIGAFTDCQVAPTCGLMSGVGLIGSLDDAASFYEPMRAQAQLLWLSRGYVEYRFPNRLPTDAEPLSLTLSCELCSEAPNYNFDWPSDITVWINGVDIGSWTSPGDFGGEPGRLTPQWWPPHNTQFGMLKTWSVDGRGTKLDGVRLGTVAIGALDLRRASYITVRIGVKPEAINPGGMNLFGREFGNYPQDLLLRVAYRPLSTHAPIDARNDAQVYA